MKKKQFIFFFFLAFFVGEMQAQFDTQFSLYTENREAINPAARTDNDDMTHASLLYKNQWFGFKEDYVGLANTPVTIAGTDWRFGVILNTSSVGLFTNQGGLLQTSYKAKLSGKFLGMDLSESFLSMGLNIGLANQRFDWGKADPTGSGNQAAEGNTFHQTEDFPNEKGDVFAWDFGAGIFFSNPSMYAGLSVLHLNAPKMDYEGYNDKLYIPRIFYLTGGYNISLSNTLYTLKPSALIKTDFNTFQAELTGLLQYNKKIQGGMSYRYQDALVFIIGINLLSGVYVNCAYDLPVSRMITSGGSFEVSLRYSLKLEFGRNSKYKVTNIL